MVKVITDFAITYCILMLYYQYHIHSYWHLLYFTIETIILYALMYNLRRNNLPQVPEPTNIVNVRAVKLENKFIQKTKPNIEPIIKPIIDPIIKKNTTSKMKMFNLIDI